MQNETAPRPRVLSARRVALLATAVAGLGALALAAEPVFAPAESLPGLSTPVALEPLVAPTPPRSALGVPSEATVYWCGQSLYKYLPQHDEVFAAIAARVPVSRFLFIEFPGSPALTARFRQRLALK